MTANNVIAIKMRVEDPLKYAPGSRLLNTMNMLVPTKQKHDRHLTLNETSLPSIGGLASKYAFEVILASVCHHWDDICIINEEFKTFVMNYAESKKVSIQDLESFVWDVSKDLYEFKNSAYGYFIRHSPRVTTEVDALQRLTEFLGISIEVHSERVVPFDRGVIHVWMVNESDLSGYFVT